MKTIVQEYGPIYGEPVNGTVQGRPNGSVYVPPSNTIILELDEDYRYVRLQAGDNTIVRVCNSSGLWYTLPSTYKSAAQAQDLADNIQIQLYDDASLTNLVVSRDFANGAFNISAGIVSMDGSAGLITNGATYYLRAQLMNNGVAVATSNVIEVEGFAE